MAECQARQHFARCEVMKEATVEQIITCPECTITEHKLLCDVCAHWLGVELRYRHMRCPNCFGHAPRLDSVQYGGFDLFQRALT